MAKSSLYFTLLILSIIIASSLYLSWSTDRGLGELILERHTIEREPGRPINFMIYEPRYSRYESPMPVVLTTHGVAGSKEGMYSFNIELARRNFTVVSVDLPGHGDSMLSFNITDFYNMALDIYAAVEFVQQRPEVDDSLYGVLTHSLGFQVAVQMQNFTNAPHAYVAVGAVADMGLGTISHLPGNFMVALGEFDEMISAEDGIDTLVQASGIEDFQPDTTYGSFENETAYRLALAPTDHVFEAIDGTIVSESCSWMIQALQGEGQLEQTLDVSSQVFMYKVFAMASGVFALLVSTIPLLFIINEKLPKKIKPAPYLTKTEPQSIKKSLILSTFLGTAFVLIFTATSSITFHLENARIYWPNSMFATGLVLFFIFFTISTIVILRIGLGRRQTYYAFDAAGIRIQSLAEYMKEFLRGLIPALIVIFWLIGWMGIGGLPDAMEPWIVFSMVRYPVGIRITNTIVIMVFAIPYYVAETAWIRGLLIDNREWNGNTFSKNIVFAIGARHGVAGFLSVVVVAVTTIFGFIAGSMVLLGLLLMLFFIVSALSTVLIAWASQEIQNPWPAIIICAFIWAWVSISSIPLI
ncbi:MAG: alpha/beta hydrolase family protein [Candidatus Thorarchaeota archaeon]